MSRVSEGRVSYLSHLILDTLREGDLATIERETLALAETKRVLHELFSYEDRLDETVRKKIESLSRQVLPGSREWDILYRKYLEEEVKKTR